MQKDTSNIQKNGNKTVFAIDLNSHELNPVEKAYKIRDINLEEGQLKIILREEEHKKHIKDGTLPKHQYTIPVELINDNQPNHPFMNNHH